MNDAVQQAGLVQVSDRNLRQKHAVMLAYLIMVIGVLYVTSSIPLFLYFHRSWWLIDAHVVDGFILIGLFYYLFRTRRVSEVMWAMCAIDIIAIVPLVLDGGLVKSGILTVTGALLVIFFLKGRSGLIFWTAFAYIPYIFALPLHMLGVLPLPYETPEYIYFLIMEFLAIMLLWLYGGEKEKLDRDLALRTRQLEEAKASVERKVQERTHELTESQAKLNSTVQSLHTIGLIMVDRDLRPVFKNAAIDHVVGYAKHDWALEDLASDFHDVDLLAECKTVLAEKKVVTLPDVKFKEGSFMRVGLNPVYDGQDVIGIVLSVQDITEAKILERSKDEFFSIASHELRTPLTAIRGNMSMVRDYFPDAMKDESLASMIDDTHAASIRLIEIVSDFLDSSKLEQGKMAFTLSPVAIAPTVESVARDLAPILKAHHNTIQLTGLDKLPRALVDEGRYRQIVYNLLSNATKYSENGTIAVTADHDGHSITLHVTDTGKGITPENQKLLFHKFQQASDPLTRDDTKGTGLGLYISKLLAQHMKGDVFLEHTEPGKGSSFGVRVGREA